MARRKAPFGTWGNHANPGANQDTEVVDVEAREVPDKARPHNQLPRD
jgi:hypothetical protein